MKRQLCLLVIVCLTLFAGAQTSGIKWTEGLSWEQIKQKAKAENKYIFLDVFATWCGPCKTMDKYVYPNDRVGNFFNSKFISVKVQTDKTKTDDDFVKSWYVDALAITKQYHIEGYPTMIIFSPQGDVVEKQMGFKSVNDLVALAQSATIAGKVFDDPYANYDRFMNVYRQGKKNDYSEYAIMITTAYKLKDYAVADKLLQEYTGYLSTLESSNRYTSELVEMWDQYLFASSTRTFQWLYNDARLINQVVNKAKERGDLKNLRMNKSGWAQTMVDKTIQAEIVNPFLEEQNKNPKIAMSGMYLSGPGMATDQSEADWKQLRKKIKKKYDADYAKRNELLARIEWYNRYRNWTSFAKYGIVYLDKYGAMDGADIGQINLLAWQAFKYSTDLKIINRYIPWMSQVVAKEPEWVEALDTYANLLYIAGRDKEAIEWEQKAVNLSAGKESEYLKIVEAMKRGEPTHGVQRMKK